MKNIPISLILLSTMSIMATSLKADNPSQDGAIRKQKSTHSVVLKERTGYALANEAFESPSSSTKPSVYWYWISNNISKDGITKDLEAMHRIGIGGVSIGHIGFKDSPVGDVSMFSPKWWECLEYAMQEAGRLGIEVSLFNSPGWSGIGGPWIKPEQAMRYMDIHEYDVKGGRKLSLSFPSYKSSDLLPQESLSFSYVIDKSTFRFQPVKVVAFPTPKGYDELISSKSPTLFSTSHLNAVDVLFDGDETTLSSPVTLPLEMYLQVNTPFTARSLEIVPGKESLSCWCKLEYLDSNSQWVEVINRYIGRGESRIIASGFLPNAPVASSFPPTTSTKYRITLSDTKNQSSSTNSSSKRAVRLTEIKLCGAIRINNYVEQQLGNKASYVPVLSFPTETEYALSPQSVIDITDYVTPEGILEWDVPSGNWTIQHCGMYQTGVKVHPVPSHDMGGFAADLFNSEIVEYGFDSFIGQILKRILPEKRPTLKSVVVDSYEQGSANWTDHMILQFIEVYGYDPTPWIPVLKGYVVGSEELSERFLWDLRRLMADMLPESFTRIVRKKSHQNGLRFWHEPYGGHGFPGEFLLFGKYSEDSAGEFWVRPTEDFATCRAATSVANIYGHNHIVSAEAFTSANNLYRSAPRDLKILCDRGFATGINHYTLHVSIHQSDDRKPGINTWYGTEFNRHNNWFEQSKTFIDYIRRCSGLLQQGRRQVDYVMYIGDDVPVDHPKPAYELPSGYDYDYINYDALVNYARVEDRRLVLPSGASYRLLVLPPSDRMRPELLSAIGRFVAAGLPIYGSQPRRSSGLKGYPDSDVEVEVGAEIIWGSGKIYNNNSLSEVLIKIGVEPDLILPSSFTYTHRKIGDDDVYFVANKTDSRQTIDLDFRIERKSVELWNPLTGEKYSPEKVEISNGRSRVKIAFAEAGSWFVVFTNKHSDRRKLSPYTTIQPIKTTWLVEFNKADGTGNFNRKLDQLSDWSISNEPEIRYFCGRATYSTTFVCERQSKLPIYLNLGRVESLAVVSLNGREIGTLWCYPYRIDISDALAEGENKLEITIVNQWWNQLIGEEQPNAKRHSYVSARNFWKATDSLVSNGLIGPVTLEQQSR